MRKWNKAAVCKYSAELGYTLFSSHGNTLTLMDAKMYPGYKMLNILDVNFSGFSGFSVTLKLCLRDTFNPDSD